MSLIEAVVEGTLKPDGTLELDEKPKLPPGRVKVVLWQEAEPKSPQPSGDDSCRIDALCLTTSARSRTSGRDFRASCRGRLARVRSCPTATNPGTAAPSRIPNS